MRAFAFTSKGFAEVVAWVADERGRAEVKKLVAPSGRPYQKILDGII